MLEEIFSTGAQTQCKNLLLQILVLVQSSK